jgi:hypothetical protein
MASDHSMVKDFSFQSSSSDQQPRRNELTHEQIAVLQDSWLGYERR